MDISINPFEGSRTTDPTPRGRRSLGLGYMEPFDLASDVHRTLPASNEAEQGYLCSLLLDIKKTIEVCPVPSEHIFNPGHRKLQEVILALHNSGVPVDIISLTGELQKLRVLDQVGGPAYLAELQTIIPTAANAPYYAEILSETYHRRELIRASGKVYEAAYEEPEGLIDASNEIIQTIDKWKNQVIASDDDPTDKKHVLEYMERLEARYDNAQAGRLEGLTTSIGSLDRTFNGLRKGRNYIIGGRPFEGKSVLWLQIGQHVARTQRPDGSYQKAILFSAEMSVDECWDRVLAMCEAASASAISMGILPETFFGKTNQILGHLRNHLFIVPAHGYTVSEIVKKTRRAMNKHPDIDLIGIDYLQNLTAETGKKNSTTTEEVTKLACDVNRMKITFNLPILCCASMNRSPEGRKDGRPKASDLRQSGQIESEADGIILMAMKPDQDNMNREGELLCVKVRGGSNRDIPIVLNKRWLRFEEPDKEEMQNIF